MSIQFEVADLAVASPATVSRCGMIFMEADILGWRTLLSSWMNLLPSGLTEDQRSHIFVLVEWILPSTLLFVEANTREILKTCSQNMVYSLMNIFGSQLDAFNSTDIALVPESVKVSWITNSFVFASIWSLGGTLDGKSRAAFDASFRDTLSSSPLSVKKEKWFPNGSVFDFVFEKDKNSGGVWKSWLETIGPYSIQPKSSFDSIIVPTADTVRYSYLLDLFITHNKHVLLVGPTGTGKSVYVNNKLLNGLPKANYIPIFINFSAQTTANQTQNIIFHKLDKRKKAVYGPPIGKKAIIFVDDLNMPAKEKYGAQPPIELLRQWMDHGAWYDLKDTSSIILPDLQFVAAMCPPGGGRNHISTRFSRHFNVLSISEFDDPTLKSIFSTIVSWHFQSNNFATEITSMTDSIVKATLEIYKSSIANLLPTPAKSHYVFNLRDFARVIQGILLATPKMFNESQKMVRLFAHEAYRVFYDRLIDNGDRQWLFQRLNEVVGDTFKVNFNKVFAHLDSDKDGKVTDEDLRSLMFCDFLDINNFAQQMYNEALDIFKTSDIIKTKLDDFNQISKAPMTLVIFRFAVEHISRISRILKQPSGHALLVGVGGSGRQSLTRLSAYIGESEIFQVEITKSYGMTEWRDDLKRILLKVGIDGQPTVFLFNDSQLKMEAFLEDINNLLNTGEVPNIFEPDERASLIDKLRVILAKDSQVELTSNIIFNHFVSRCKHNLHIVLCFSPIGDAFRNRLRMFPALVNCCTIDWFQVWPEDALDLGRFHFDFSCFKVFG